MGDGRPKQEFIYVDDLAQIIWEVLELSAEQYSSPDRPNSASHINVGTGTDICISELASVIADVVGYRGSTIFDEKSLNGVARKVLDITIQENAGWEAPTRLEEGLLATYKSFSTTAEVDHATTI